jgi:hypothetical protein
MTADLEKLLREGIDRLTADARLRPDIVKRAQDEVARRNEPGAVISPRRRVAETWRHRNRLRIRVMAPLGAAAAMACVAIAVAVAGNSGPHGHGGPQGHGGARTRPTPIVIDPAVGDTFAPAPAAAAPALTAAQAWAQYAKVNGGSATIPSSLTAQLGLVSVPVGPANGDPDQAGLATSNGIAYLALNELAYGYSSPPGSCPMSRNPKVEGPIGKSCVDWTFVDANTGQLIEATSQVLS